jgi:class 3 adenylate cyclase
MSTVLEPAALDRARKALEDHAWEQAYDAFVEADRQQALIPEDLELLADAAWWSAHPNEKVDALERAYAGYSARGDRRRAALAAVKLANMCADHRETAIQTGWIRRAERLLDGLPEGIEHGYLHCARAFAMWFRGDQTNTLEHGTAALDIGSRLGDANLQAYGLMIKGEALVAQARVQEGLEFLDEATVAAVAGDLEPYTTGIIYCAAIGVSRDLSDYRRAGQWTEVAKRWCERQAITGFPGICRVHQAEIARLRGAFSEAEAAARTAADELIAFGRLSFAAMAYYELGEVRLRIGDLDGAEQAFTHAHQLGQEPEPGMSQLLLARGRIETARTSIATSLMAQHDLPARARLLPAQIEIALAAHDQEEARAAAEELDEIARRYDAPPLRAAAHQALGMVRVHEGDAQAAAIELRRAFVLWTESDLPFDAATARRWLAMAYRAAANETSARMELLAARGAFEHLGAGLEVKRCDDLLRGENRLAGKRVSRAFMFTDIVASTQLLGTMGDEMWEGVLRWHDETLRTLIGKHRGKVVHTTGDGVFASFVGPAEAIACAIAIQQRLLDHRRDHGFAPPVRIGLHAAEATEIGGDYAGLGVHEAARVGAAAEGGEILVTTETLAAIAVPEFQVGIGRELTLKGLPEPVLVVPIEWRLAVRA